MDEAPEHGKDSAHANGMNEWMNLDNVRIKVCNNVSSYLNNFKNTQLFYKESNTISIAIYLPFHRGILV
jgi:hypothetical protein